MGFMKISAGAPRAPTAQERRLALNREAGAMKRGIGCRDGLQAMGGRNGGAAGAGGTGAFGPADPCPAGGTNATHTHGTVITAVDAAKQWHAVWQQSPCPVCAMGVDTSRDRGEVAIVSWQCGAGFPICACDCGACIAPTPVAGAPNANAVQASNASASVRRKTVEFGRGTRSMRRSIDAAKPPLNSGAGFMRRPTDTYTSAIPGIEP